ncbi:MAG: acyl-CoA dehydrogenase family protein [Paracoccaceae bacterium]
MEDIIVEVDMDKADRAAGAGLARTAARLAEDFSTRAEAHDSEESFVAENYGKLMRAGFMRAAVPAELGGGGAGIAEMGEVIRVLAHGCGSTALAFAMHTHQVVIPAWRWRHQPAAKAAVEPLLKRVATTDTVLLSSGGTDWVGGSGRAERVEGGWRIHARKVFVSGAPAGTLLMTSAVAGDEVIHFALPMDAPEVKVLDTWHTLGMRGTASHDVEIDGFFVPDDKVPLKRAGGQWHPVWHIIATLAFPLIYAAYLGVAESARDIAVGIARNREGAARQPRVAGEMEVRLRAAQIAHARMIAIAEENAPSAGSVNEVMIGRRLVEENTTRAVELAMELAGGMGFYRRTGLERRLRDVQAARYHPLRREVQELYAGSMALGDPVDRIF